MGSSIRVFHQCTWHQDTLGWRIDDRLCSSFHLISGRMSWTLGAGVADVERSGAAEYGVARRASSETAGI
ncbi:hypothetical protein L3Q82_004441 [Scortum barcoo]|uniref:Uncharacterized protein n=1 Tax=Scortum barcoo TaxID=214431 RepID=A0ACB8VJP2_9TELE|nr:hypothetical protein L3Q82_004441 [Scortum barcoo]